MNSLLRPAAHARLRYGLSGSESGQGGHRRAVTGLKSMKITVNSAHDNDSTSMIARGVAVFLLRSALLFMLLRAATMTKTRTTTRKEPFLTN